VLASIQSIREQAMTGNDATISVSDLRLLFAMAAPTNPSTNEPRAKAKDALIAIDISFGKYLLFFSTTMHLL
jgi:hypothetical protein